MCDSEIEKKEIIRKFGLNPDEIGNRPRGWWIVEKIRDEEERGNAKEGDLCIYTRDGVPHFPDVAALERPNFLGSAEGNNNCIYRCYYYKPLKEDKKND